MLRKINPLISKEAESQRLWFTDQQMDLILWLDEDDKILGFQLCYDKRCDERVLAWHADKGYQHSRIDDGETSPLSFKKTPILLSDGVFEADFLAEEFRHLAADINPDLRAFVLKKIKLYSGVSH